MSVSERDNIEARLRNYKKHLRVVELRISEYINQEEVPLEHITREKELKKIIEELEKKLQDPETLLKPQIGSISRPSIHIVRDIPSNEYPNDIRTRNWRFLRYLFVIIGVVLSIFAGIYWYKQVNNWKGEVNIDSKYHHLGDVVMERHVVIQKTDGTTETLTMSFNNPEPEGSEYNQSFLTIVASS